MYGGRIVNAGVVESVEKKSIPPCAFTVGLAPWETMSKLNVLAPANAGRTMVSFRPSGSERYSISAPSKAPAYLSFVPSIGRISPVDSLALPARR